MIMNTYHAALWSTSPSNDERYRISHQKRTKQRGQDGWTWEEILDVKGPWTQIGEYRRPREEIEAAKEERQRYEELVRQ
jgi:head-tail adaptor